MKGVAVEPAVMRLTSNKRLLGLSRLRLTVHYGKAGSGRNVPAKFLHILVDAMRPNR